MHFFSFLFRYFLLPLPHLLFSSCYVTAKSDLYNTVPSFLSDLLESMVNTRLPPAFLISVRLLLTGTFQDVDHVIICGVAGSVPHIWEFEKHSRLGDVVVSAPRIGNDEREYLYVFCDKITEVRDSEDPVITSGFRQFHLTSPPTFLSPQAADNKGLTFTLKKWTPTDKRLLNCAERLMERQEKTQKCPWSKYVDEGLQSLHQLADTFDRPSAETDRLHMTVSGVVLTSGDRISSDQHRGIWDLLLNSFPIIFVEVVFPR